MEINKEFKEPLLGWNAVLPEEPNEFLRSLKEMVSQHIIGMSTVQAATYRGSKIILSLFEALSNEPEMLLLDEPTAGINPTLINGIIDRLIKVNQDFGITLLVIEHNMRVIMQLAESIFCLAHGKMLANGSPEEIKNDKRVIDAYLGAQ